MVSSPEAKSTDQPQVVIELPTKKLVWSHEREIPQAMVYLHKSRKEVKKCVGAVVGLQCQGEQDWALAWTNPQSEGPA